MMQGAPKGYSMFELPTMGKDQKQLYDYLKSQFLSRSPGVYDQLSGLASGQGAAYDQLEAPTMRFYNEKLAPSIANRYGVEGAGRSSGFQNSLAAGASNLAEGLQAQRAGIQQKAMSDILGMGNQLLGMPTSEFGITEKPSFLKDLIKMLGAASGPGLGLIGSLF